MLEKRRRDNSADRVASPVLRTGTTAAVAVKACYRVGPTRLKLAPEDIAIAHHTSIVDEASPRSAQTFEVQRRSALSEDETAGSGKRRSARFGPARR
jgi:hypothetical protein